MTKTNVKILALFACAFAITTGCDKPAASDNDAPDALEKLFSIPAFTLTDQDNQPFGTDQLKGKTWIATLFFSNCPGPCPMMQGRLNAIEDALHDPNILIVSVSVDPKNDTPDKLKAYAHRMGVDEHRRFFLTGPQEKIQEVAGDFKLAYEPATDDKPIVHATKFLLVDKSGNVRGIYATEDDESMKKLKADALRLDHES